jgi:asparagine synthase (glutamine-hydrolysing)
MPGIFGAASGQPRRAAGVPLESLGRRLRVQPGLSTRFARSDDGRAVIGAVDLGVLPGSGIPQRAHDGSLAVVHGEITNLDPAADLALELIARCRRDPATLAQLEGSFVAAVWDAERGQLFLVNDRFGLRNLYFAIAKGVLVFAPLVAPLLDVPGVDDTLDLGAVADLLAFEHVLGARTLARGVQALPPASLARFENGELHVERYWTPRYRPGRGTLDDYTNELERLLGAASRRAFRGPERAGLPLSAGLDSRAILASVGGDLPAGTPCFTYGARGSFDYVLGARLAAVVGAPHHAFELAPGYIAARFEEMIGLTDGMQLGLNAHAVVLQECARVCDLIVLGNGGDCALDRLWWWNDADPDREGFQRRMFERLNLGLAPGLVPVVLRGEALSELLDGTRARLAERLARYGGDTAADVADAFNVGERHWRWVLQGVPAQSTHVEFRQPFYDYRVVDLALEVPLAMRSGRRLHIELISRTPRLAAVPFKGQTTLPASEVFRRAASFTRRMFGAFERAWRNASGAPLPLRPQLRGFADYEHELRTASRSIVERYILSERTLERGWYRAEGLRALAEAHLARRANHARVLGTVATLEHWLRTLEDRALREAPGTPQAAGGAAGGD